MILDPMFPRIGLGLGDASRIDVHSHRADPEFFRGGHHDPPIAASQVIKHVARLHGGELQHVIHNLRRQGQESGEIRPWAGPQDQCHTAVSISKDARARKAG